MCVNIAATYIFHQTCQSLNFCISFRNWSSPLSPNLSGPRSLMNHPDISLKETWPNQELEMKSSCVRAVEHPHQACPHLGLGASGHNEYQMGKVDLSGFSKPFRDTCGLKRGFYLKRGFK